MDQGVNKIDFSKLPCFSLLDEDSLMFLRDNSRLIHDLNSSSFIVKQNQPCNEVFFIVNGSVKLTIDDKLSEHISIILHDHQIFGECCLYGHSNYMFNAKSIEPKTTLIAIKSDAIIELMKRNFDFNLSILSVVGSKLQKTEDRLYALAKKDARQRILDFLKSNAEYKGKKIGLEMLIKHGLTQQDIANFTGTSRQTVTTVLNDLQNKNKIFLRRKSILIRDLATLN